MTGIVIDVRNRRVDEIRDAIDGGTGNGFLTFYDGVQPATGGSPTQSLGFLNLPKPVAPNSVNGVLTFNPIPPNLVFLPGVTTWARIVDGNSNVTVIDFSVGLPGSGADIIMDDTTIVFDGTIAIDSFVLVEGNP